MKTDKLNRLVCMALVLAAAMIISPMATLPVEAAVTPPVSCGVGPALAGSTEFARVQPTDFSFKPVTTASMVELYYGGGGGNHYRCQQARHQCWNRCNDEGHPHRCMERCMDRHGCS